MKKFGSVVYHCKNNFCAYLGKIFKGCECLFFSDSNNYVKIKHHKNTMFTKLRSKCDTIDGQATEKQQSRLHQVFFFFDQSDWTWGSIFQTTWFDCHFLTTQLYSSLCCMIYTTSSTPHICTYTHLVHIVMYIMVFFQEWSEYPQNFLKNNCSLICVISNVHVQ